MEFYERLENMLKSRNITVYKMCKDLKISTNTIGNYKNGTIPKIDIVNKISLYLGISTDYLIKGEEFNYKIQAAYDIADPGTQAAVRKLLDINEYEEQDIKSLTSKIG